MHVHPSRACFSHVQIDPGVSGTLLSGPGDIIVRLSRYNGSSGLLLSSESWSLRSVLMHVSFTSVKSSLSIFSELPFILESEDQDLQLNKFSGRVCGVRTTQC